MTAASPRRSRAEVEQAIVDAAIEIARVEGVRAATMRRVANDAGVNTGLLHRYFGSRRALLGRALDQLAAGVAAQMGPAIDLSPGGSLDLYTRVLLSAIDEGLDPLDIQLRHPVMDRLLELGRERRLADDSARVAAAQIFALFLGWQAFGAFASSLAGIDSTPTEQRRDQLRNAALAIAAAAQSSE